jgi:hypothetical protein
MTQTFVTSGSQVAASGSGSALSPEAVLEILRGGYGEPPHNLPSQEGFGSNSEQHNHAHAAVPVFAVSNPLEATGTATTAGGYVLAAPTSDAGRLAQLAAAEISVFDSLDDGEQQESGDYTELARQFESDALGSLMDQLQLTA